MSLVTNSRMALVHWRCRHPALLLAVVASLHLGLCLDVARAGDQDAAIEAAIATITEGEVREHAGLLADDTLEGRAAGSRGGIAAAKYIEKKLKEAGLEPAGDRGSYIQRFTPGYQNVIGMIRGTDPQLRDQYIVVGAHFDHVGYGNQSNSNGPIGYIHNGADDNASGVAALLEIIDALHRAGWQPRRSIVFAFWDGEEINLLGSRHWVRQPTVPREGVKLAINADMVGRLTNGRLEVAGTRTADGLRQLFSSPRLPEEMRLDFTWEYKENSDHWPFYVDDIPSLLIHTGLHSDYHRPSDDIEKLNVAGIRQAAAYLLEVIGRAADVDALPEFRPASRSETASMRAQREAPLSPLPPRLGLRWLWIPAKTADAARADEVAQGAAVGQMRVTEVTPGSAADKAGLKIGDVIVAADGRPLAVEAYLPAAVLAAKDSIRLDVARGDEPVRTVDVALDGEPSSIGFSWRPDSAAPGAVFVTRVIPYSPAARAKIGVHDRIYGIEGEPFADQEALLEGVRELIDSGAETITFEVETAGRLRPVEVDLRLPGADRDDPSL
ncbi:Aminopeptidase S [Lacipirellula limnantheis]|uniref:Aminopeptidase S n=2 Tax=Lacipirellula limnantheis TaxID=2528024 RepID=A0A517TX38_9BACT|nr:Aminopeptidase S [Lacipirellula limnantheis]